MEPTALKPTLLPHPNAYASGYLLHLYCKWLNAAHVYDEFPHEYTGEYGPDVFREARQQGWIIHRDRTATCPKCAKEVKTW